MSNDKVELEVVAKDCSDGKSCAPLRNFRALVIGILSLQAVFVTVPMVQSVSIQKEQARQAQELMAVSTRQEMIEQKADTASADALKALAISGKAESNIAWIREGLTELKIAVREQRGRAGAK